LKNSYGITGTVYYGYRAWGPNWPYNSTWTSRAAHRLRQRRRRQRQPLQPEQAAARPYAREISHDPNTPTCTDGT
jgi:isoamylase